MFDWLKNIFKKKKVAKQDKGLLVDLEELNDLTDLPEDKLIPIKDEKVIDFVKRRRKNSRRKNGHRQPKTELKILEIKIN